MRPQRRTLTCNNSVGQRDWCFEVVHNMFLVGERSVRVPLLADLLWTLTWLHSVHNDTVESEGATLHAGRRGAQGKKYRGRLEGRYCSEVGPFKSPRFAYSPNPETGSPKLADGSRRGPASTIADLGSSLADQLGQCTYPSPLYSVKELRKSLKQSSPRTNIALSNELPQLSSPARL